MYMGYSLTWFTSWAYSVSISHFHLVCQLIIITNANLTFQQSSRLRLCRSSGTLNHQSSPIYYMVPSIFRYLDSRVWQTDGQIDVRRDILEGNVALNYTSCSQCAAKNNRVAKYFQAKVKLRLGKPSRQLYGSRDRFVCLVVVGFEFSILLSKYRLGRWMIDFRNRHICRYNCKYFDLSVAADVSGSVAFCLCCRNRRPVQRCCASCYMVR